MTGDEHLQDVALRIRDLQTTAHSIEDRLSLQKMSDHDLLIRLNTQSEGIAQSLHSVAMTQAAQAVALDNRLRVLEQTRWLMLGAAGAIGALGGYIVRVWRP